MSVRVLDCTLRDGGYYNSWRFSDDLVADYLTAVSRAGVDFVEIGFRNFPQTSFVGPYAYSTDAGATFSAGLPVSPSFDSTIGHPQQNKIGDYYHMISSTADAALAYSALVSQSTGEDWTGVELELSTASPANMATVPALSPRSAGFWQPPQPQPMAYASVCEPEMEMCGAPPQQRGGGARMQSRAAPMQKRAMAAPVAKVSQATTSATYR